MEQTKVRKDQVGIDGENETTEIASKVFFGEFVFSDLWFSHKNVGQGTNIQLADLIINIGYDLLAFQVKTRNGKPIDGGDKKWIEKQIKLAKGQLVDTFNNLQIYGLPEFVNKKGDKIPLEKQGLFSGIIILKNEAIQDYRKILKSARLNGIFHCFSYQDFCICCDRLVIPADILSYLSFRERYYGVDCEISEQEEICVDKFLISKYGTSSLEDNFLKPYKWFLNEYKNRLIDEGNDLTQYREIVNVLAMFDRVEIDTFFDLLGKVREAAKHKLVTDHLFMKPFNGKKHSVLFISMNKWNVQHVSRVTELFMYKTKTEKCLTGTVSFEDDVNYRIDWLLNEHDWYADSGMEHLIIELGAENKWTPNKIITGKVENDKKSD